MSQGTFNYPIFVFINILVALLISFCIGWLAIRWAKQLNLIDVPGALPHKMHELPTPLAGGLTLVVALFACILVLDVSLIEEFWNILLPALVIFGVGLWDDAKRLPASIKLVGQIVAGIVLVALGTSVKIIQPGFMGLPGDSYIALNVAITLFWVVGITNAFNFIDSMDGLVVGISSIALAFLILVTLGSPQTELLKVLTIMLGICIGLYFFNAPPAKFFLGDSGAQTFGFLLACIGIIYTPVNYPQASSWFLPIMVLGVPIFDTVLVVISRFRRRLPAYRAGHDHTYHRLVALGLGTNQAVTLMHLVGISLGCLAFIALNLAPVQANIIFGMIVALGFLFIIMLDWNFSSE